MYIKFYNISFHIARVVESNPIQDESNKIRFIRAYILARISRYATYRNSASFDVPNRGGPGANRESLPAMASCPILAFVPRVPFVFRPPIARSGSTENNGTRRP